LLYYDSEDAELAKQSLLTLHCCFRKANFREICLNIHKFSASAFDSFVRQSIDKYTKTSEAELWDLFVNVCASITAFVTAFPERLIEYQSLIIPLIKVISNKTQLVRKNAAVLLAKLANDEKNAEIMRANHGTEVLVSLRG